MLPDASSRALRSERKARTLARFGRPLIFATVVMPAPVTDSALPRRVLSEALWCLHAICDRRRWPVLAGEISWLRTGPEAIYVINADERLLKSATVDLKDQHPLGRLWHLDVVVPEQSVLWRGASAAIALAYQRLY